MEGVADYEVSGSRLPITVLRGGPEQVSTPLPPPRHPELFLTKYTQYFVSFCQLSHQTRISLRIHIAPHFYFYRSSLLYRRYRLKIWQCLLRV